MSGAPGTSVAGVGAEDDDDSEVISSGNVFSPGQSSYVSSVTTSTTKIKVEEILSVWDFPRVEKLGSKGVLQTQTWKCGWCGSIFKGWNATKVLNHCTKTHGKTDIKACTGNIPREIMAALLAFKHTKTGLSTMKRLHNEPLRMNSHTTRRLWQLLWKDPPPAPPTPVVLHLISTLPNLVALVPPILQNSPLQLLKTCIANDCCSCPLKELTLHKLSNLPSLHLLPMLLLLAKFWLTNYWISAMKTEWRRSCRVWKWMWMFMDCRCLEMGQL
jgi:hypothetical protein